MLSEILRIRTLVKICPTKIVDTKTYGYVWLVGSVNLVSEEQAMRNSKDKYSVLT